MCKKEGLYIRIIKHVHENPGCTIQNITEELGLNDEQVKQLAYHIGYDNIFYKTKVNYIHQYQNNHEIPLYLTVEDEFRLLEYVELKEARESSKRATYIAIAAIVISIMTTLIVS